MPLPREQGYWPSNMLTRCLIVPRNSLFSWSGILMCAHLKQLGKVVEGKTHKLRKHCVNLGQKPVSFLNSRVQYHVLVKVSNYRCGSRIWSRGAPGSEAESCQCSEASNLRWGSSSHLRALEAFGF